MFRSKSHLNIVCVCLFVLSLVLSGCTGQSSEPPSEAVRRYEAGVAFQNAGQLEKAAQEFEAVLKLEVLSSALQKLQ